MPKSTIELVKKLIVQLRRFTELSEGFGPMLQGMDLMFSAELSYSRFRFDIKRSKELYFQYTVFQKETGPGNPECYCTDTALTEGLRKHFEPFAADLYKISMDGDLRVAHTEHWERYLAIAESIATHGYLCSSGDDYRPGYFSKITVDAERIVLEQVNHMNSRSLDHKHSYSMRDLEFDIPLLRQPAQKTSIRFQEHDIGIMRIRFSDRSSQVKRSCGDKILEAIEAEKQKFAASQS